MVLIACFIFCLANYHTSHCKFLHHFSKTHHVHQQFKTPNSVLSLKPLPYYMEVKCLAVSWVPYQPSAAFVLESPVVRDCAVTSAPWTEAWGGQAASPRGLRPSHAAGTGGPGPGLPVLGPVLPVPDVGLEPGLCLRLT